MEDINDNPFASICDEIDTHVDGLAPIEKPAAISVEKYAEKMHINVPQLVIAANPAKILRQ